MAQEKILVVDDEPEMGWLFSKILGEEGYKVLTACTGQEGITKVKEEMPDLVFLDIRFPGMDGIEVLKEIRRFDKDLLVIMLTGYESVKTAVAAMKLGAYDYLSKPIDNEKIKIVIENALKTRRLTREVGDLQKEIRKRFAFERIIGNSLQMEKVFDLIKRVATYDVTVLLRGASGTGKELIAQAIHYASSRSRGPFVAIDCATLPETLVESEIFGYERGAFTGAEARKLGKFELAQGGTLFLDEIGNLSPNTQVKLLRALQEKKIERLGGKRPIGVDVRVIAATSVNLEEAMEKGLFREDLYHRLNVFPIRLPLLREREGDVPLLAEYFLAEFNKELKKEVKKISEEARELLVKYSWPGNVRELENTIKSAVLLAEDTILPQHLPQKIQAVRDEVRLSELKGPLKEVSKRATQKIEKELITKVLREVHWNKSKAAKLLNVDYKTLYNKIKEYGIKR